MLCLDPWLLIYLKGVHWIINLKIMVHLFQKFYWQVFMLYTKHRKSYGGISWFTIQKVFAE